MEGSGDLVQRCIDAAAKNANSVEIWRRQRRTLERLPPNLADSLLRLLLDRRLLYPSLLEVFQHCVQEVVFHGENYLDAEWMLHVAAFRHLRVLSLSGCRGITNSAVFPLNGMLSLKELDLSRCVEITDAGIAHIVSIPHLEKLNISETGATSEGISLLSSLVNLRSLDLGRLPCTDQAMHSLTVLVNIEYLDLCGSEITDEGSSLLTIFQRLTRLNIASTKVQNLPYLPSLTYLNMSNCTILSISPGRDTEKQTLSELVVQGATFPDVDQAFRHVDVGQVSFLDLSSADVSNFSFLAKMRSLERLDLSSTLMNDDLIVHLAGMGSTLRDLNLSGTHITSQSLKFLAGNLPNLESLSLSGCMIDDTSMRYIALMPSLRSLDLSRTSIQGFIDDEQGDMFSLSMLQNLCNLETLNLEDTPLNDDALRSLGFHGGLKALYLNSAFFSDDSFYDVLSLPSLKILGFRGAMLTDTALLSVNPSEKLEALDLRDCWLLSEEAVSSFCEKSTQITVKHDFVQFDLRENEA